MKATTYFTICKYFAKSKPKNALLLMDSINTIAHNKVTYLTDL